MLTPGRYFPEHAGSDEQVVLFIRRHWFSFVSWLLLVFVMGVTPPLLLAVTIGGSVRLGDLSLEVRTLIVLLTSAYYLFTLAVFLVAWLDFYLDVTIVTPRRLVDIHQNGLFNHQVSEQSLLRVQDVSVRVEGPFQTFFQYGTVYVETAGEAPNFVMRNLPKPNAIANRIIELHTALIDQGYVAAATGSGDDGMPQRLNPQRR